MNRPTKRGLLMFLFGPDLKGPFPRAVQQCDGGLGCKNWVKKL